MCRLFVALLTLFGAACGDPTGLSWSAEFEPGDLRSEADRVEVAIRRGSCAAPDVVVYAETLASGDQPSAPPELVAGEYAFIATASSARCGDFAFACEQVSLPGVTKVSLRLAVTDAGLARCPDLAGIVDAGADAWDAGEDAETDAEIDAEIDAGIDAQDAEPDAETDAAADADAAVASDAGEDAASASECPTDGLGGHLSVASVYWARTEALGDYLADVTPAFRMAHVDLPGLEAPLPEGVDVIVDLHWNLFDYTTHTIRADVPMWLDRLEAAYVPKRDHVRAFYLVDEPYLAGHEIPRTELEAMIAMLHARFPDVATYITFGHHCFDPASTESVCVVPPASRGIPAGLDWAGFDWYNESSDDAQIAGHTALRIVPGIDRIAALSPATRVMLVPEAYTNATRSESAALATMQDYFLLAEARDEVIGVDFFLWADVPEAGFLGMRSLPSVRIAARGYARRVASACGSAGELIAVTQWRSATDYRYEAAPWSGRAAGYHIEGTAFALPPHDAPRALPIYHCLATRTETTVDSFLSFDDECDGQPIAAPSVLMGGVFASEEPGTFALHVYAQGTFPWDHVYGAAGAVLPVGYSDLGIFGYVYPASSL